MTINNKSERNYRGKCLGWPVTSYGAGFLEFEHDAPLFTENAFDFWYDSGKTFAKSAKSFDSFAILSSRNDPFRNIRSLRTPSF